MTDTPTLEDRVAALEAAFEDVKKQKGIMGSRGPAGPIDAAVANARAALAEDLAATQALVRTFDGKLDARIRQKIDDAANDIKQRIERFQRNMELEITAVVLQVLQQYWVLDSECRVLDHLQRPACDFSQVKKQ